MQVGTFYELKIDSIHFEISFDMTISESLKYFKEKQTIANKNFFNETRQSNLGISCCVAYVPN